MSAADIAVALGDTRREGDGRLPHGRHSLARLDDPGADHRPLRIVLRPTGSGKWRATIDGEVICVSASPFVKSGRVLLEKGYPADAVIEIWHVGASEWALRGQLGAVAATLVDGETSGRAKNASPVDVRSAGYVSAPSGHTRIPGPFLDASLTPRTEE